MKMFRQPFQHYFIVIEKETTEVQIFAKVFTNYKDWLRFTTICRQCSIVYIYLYPSVRRYKICLRNLKHFGRYKPKSWSYSTYSEIYIYIYAKYFRKERFRLNVVNFLSSSVGCNFLPVSVVSPFSNLKDPCPLWWCATIQLDNMLTLKPHLLQ